MEISRLYSLSQSVVLLITPLFDVQDYIQYLFCATHTHQLNLGSSTTCSVPSTILAVLAISFCFPVSPKGTIQSSCLQRAQQSRYVPKGHDILCMFSHGLTEQHKVYFSTSQNPSTMGISESWDVQRAETRYLGSGPKSIVINYLDGSRIPAISLKSDAFSSISVWYTKYFLTLSQLGISSYKAFIFCQSVSMAVRRSYWWGSNTAPFSPSRTRWTPETRRSSSSFCLLRRSIAVEKNQKHSY